jgi:hypothetical protein
MCKLPRYKTGTCFFDWGEANDIPKEKESEALAKVSFHGVAQQTDADGKAKIQGCGRVSLGGCPPEIGVPRGRSVRIRPLACAKSGHLYPILARSFRCEPKNPVSWKNGVFHFFRSAAVFKTETTAIAAALKGTQT